MAWWEARDDYVRDRSQLMVPEACVLWLSCDCQACIDRYVEYARWHARRRRLDRLLLDDRAVRVFRNSDSLVIEAGFRLLGRGSAGCVRLCS